MKSGTPAFSEAWRELAAKESEAFRTAEHDFIQRTHYRETVNNVTPRYGYVVNGLWATLRDVVWSTSVQQGQRNRVVDEAIANVDKTITRDDPRFERTVIEAVYAERVRQDDKGGLFHFSRSTDIWVGLNARFGAEGAEALKRFDAETKPR